VDGKAADDHVDALVSRRQLGHVGHQPLAPGRADARRREQGGRRREQGGRPGYDDRQLTPAETV
jgi:hypothetical protein